jgi:hypothetical protein
MANLEKVIAVLLIVMAVVTFWAVTIGDFKSYVG